MRKKTCEKKHMLKMYCEKMHFEHAFGEKNAKNIKQM